MRFIHVDSFDEWRTAARELILLGQSPSTVKFSETNDQPSLFANSETNESGNSESSSTRPAPNANTSFHVSKAFLSLAETVACHRDSGRWNLLYRTLYRLVNGEPKLLAIMTDDDVSMLIKMEKEVRRDCHKMKAFVRFRKIVEHGEEHFIAWHRPDHRIVRRVAPFFSRRFRGMNWTILTPDESVVWDQATITYGEGVPRSSAPASDDLEQLWKTYYASIFNPARVKIKMMKSEMPVRHWPTLPEAEIIADLLHEAPARVERMIQQHEGFATTAQDQIAKLSDVQTIDQLAAAAKYCVACDLHRDATQVVFGSGPGSAAIVLIGEQPGDLEDLQGKPFVGPAGEILNEAMASAGIDRQSVYITNIVKHFKHKTAGGRLGTKRIHQRPNAREIRCCKPWFDAEWNLLSEAKVLVCLGATAAKAVVGPDFRLTQNRGVLVNSGYCAKTIATWHPSAILRSVDLDAKETKLHQLKQDLRLCNELLGE